MTILRSNAKLSTALGISGFRFLNHAAGAIDRLLPHVQVSAWKEGPWKKSGCVWSGTDRKSARVTITIGHAHRKTTRSLTATVKRKSIGGAGSVSSEIVDTREHDICNLVAQRTSSLLTNEPAILRDAASLDAISTKFDEAIVASHLQQHHNLKLPISEVLGSLHTLSEQSYENKALTFGCILNPNLSATDGESLFPGNYLRSKKYKALSDGFRTAYLVSDEGVVIDFLDLDRLDEKPLTEKHHYPDWTESIARASRNGSCGIVLSRQGDILVFDEGTLRFTYRYGQWQYWNHTHLIKLLRDRAKAQHVPKKVLGRVVGAIYRAAVDVSFRRCGGLFVILHNKNSLRSVVKDGDAIADSKRARADCSFDAVVAAKAIQNMPRAVAVELASLDGAVVLRNSGEIAAYGAVLQPRRAGRIRGSEGSRTKAAIGASNYGIAVKISSDGDISVYHEGRAFIKM